VAGDEVRIPIRADTDVVTARQEGRQLASTLGFTPTEVTLIATAISEVARNIVSYADEGELCVAIVQEGGRRGIRVVATDRGPGIEDVDKALQDGFSSGLGMGLGLPGARRLMDEFRLDSGPGSGTTVEMTRWESGGV
jgi:serine/threonine-protein kinase RsbT